MTKDDFTEGDLVCLKSGGPLMTYEGESMGGEAMCVWFDGKKKISETFAYTSLEKGEKPKATSVTSGMF